MKSTIRTDKELVSVLTQLYVSNNNKVRPKDVVDFARPSESPLHRYFEWDDTVASEKYREWQARKLLQTVYVRMVMPNGENRLEQVFVSLKDDRINGGYRTMVDVLSNADMRNQLVRDALFDMQTFEQRYKALRELALVFASMGKAKKKLIKA